MAGNSRHGGHGGTLLTCPPFYTLPQGPWPQQHCTWGLGDSSIVCVPAMAVAGSFFFLPLRRPRPRGVKKKFSVEGLCTPGTEGCESGTLKSWAWTFLHTGSLHAMAVWGTPLGICTQGGYAWSPTAVCPCYLNTFLLCLPMVSPQASQCNPVGA
jgi:hypothetical protein